MRKSIAVALQPGARAKKLEAAAAASVEAVAIFEYELRVHDGFAREVARGLADLGLATGYTGTRSVETFNEPDRRGAARDRARGHACAPCARGECRVRAWRMNRRGERRSGADQPAAVPVRRVVTGHDEQGRSVVLFDSAAPNVKGRAQGNVSTFLWVTDETPANVSGRKDRAAREIGAPPPKGGTIFRLAEFPPSTGTEERLDHAAVLRDFGIDDDALPGSPPRHPVIHRTRTIDYVVVQQGANHAWTNRGQVRCRLAMVFVDAEEPAAPRAQ